MPFGERSQFHEVASRSRPLGDAPSLGLLTGLIFSVPAAAQVYPVWGMGGNAGEKTFSIDRATKLAPPCADTTFIVLPERHD